MSKPSSATRYGKPRKSKWNRELFNKLISPLPCQMCGNLRNKFIKMTQICCLCAVKIQKKQSRLTKAEVEKK